MAGRPHRSAGSRRSPGTDDLVELEQAEVPPAARVQRSRLAFALAITLAALPILVLDNFPATADAAEGVEVLAEVITTDAPTTTVAPELATTSTEAPATTVAPSTTLAPTTTVAPAPPTTRAPVRVAAPRPTTTTTAAPVSYAYGDPADPATWDRLAQCESGGNWAANTGNGYYGGLQFSLSTWQHHGGTGYPHQASRETQIEIGRRLQAAKGWSAWPGCSSKLGYS